MHAAHATSGFQHSPCSRDIFPSPLHSAVSLPTRPMRLRTMVVCDTRIPSASVQPPDYFCCNFHSCWPDACRV
eukprot:6211843-Pleurochrysis_carterae.AAC.4